MNIQEALEKLKTTQKNLLEFIDNDNDIEENYQNLLVFLKDQQIQANPHKLRLFLKMLLKISENHFRGPNFFAKIEKIINNFKKEIKQYYTNFEIFNLFKSNKRILLFLLEEKIFEIDDKIIPIFFGNSKYENMKYPQYFSPELKPFINNSSVKKELILNEIPEDFNEKRKIGENDTKICELIRKDMIEEFIILINKEEISLNSFIDQSIFETNQPLLKIYHSQNLYKQYQAKINDLELIEYAAFYGSVQIFKYLYKNNVEFRPSLWIYAVHGNNPEIFHILEEKNIEAIDKSFYVYLFEALKCHHNDMATYIQSNYLKIEKQNQLNILSKCLKYYNFCLFYDEQIDKYFFYDCCRYDYYQIVEILLKDKDLDINEIVVSLFNSYLFSLKFLFLIENEFNVTFSIIFLS